MTYDHLSKWPEDRVKARIEELTGFQMKIFEEMKRIGCSERYALFLAISWPDNVTEAG